MKQFFLTVLTLLIAHQLIGYFYLEAIDSDNTEYSVSYKVWNALQSHYLGDPLTNRCSEAHRRNTTEQAGNGCISADYFGCDRFQRWLNKRLWNE